VKKVEIKKIGILSLILIPNFFCTTYYFPMNRTIGISYHFLNTKTLQLRSCSQKETSTQLYAERGPITITSDFQLNNSEFPGNGTIDDPIRIENFYITDPSDTLVGLIDIRSTTYYFRIVNCLINGLGTIGNGIYFDDVIHGTIVNNTIYNNGWSGVNVARRSDFNIIANNTIFNNSEDGIRLGEGIPSHNNTLYNNTIYKNGWNGILVTASENNTIESNTIYNSGRVGIVIESGSDNCSIIENHVYSNKGSGICIKNAESNKIFNNSIHENDWNGIFLVQSSNNFISNNTVHDHNYTGILLFSSSNNTISHNIAYNHNRSGIKIGEADSNNNTIFSNTIYNSGGSGILVGFLPIFSNIINNTCFNNSRNWSGSSISDYATSGISICSSANVSNNSVFDNFDNGILIWNVSKNTVVSNNIIRNNGRHGISVAFANTTTVANNEVFNNTNDGIHLFGSLNNSVLNNSIYNNLITGISLSPFDDLGISRNSDNNTIDSNVIYDNSMGGIEINGGNNNSLISNDFSGNNAIDDGSDNVFTSNYWSDWSGTDSYAIEGSTENQDLSPLTNPHHITAPRIIAPTTVNITLVGNVVIQWTASVDTFGHSLTYSILYSTNDGGSWTTLASGLTTTSYTFDTTIFTDGTYILLKIHTVDSVGFIAKSASTETLTIQNRVEEPNFLTIQMILIFLLAVCSIASGYYLVNVKFRTPSFTEYFQSDKIEFLKPIYHKVIIGLENITTAIMSETVVTPLLEEPTMPTSLVNWFPTDYRSELQSEIKGRTILTLIEVAFLYAEEANLTILVRNLDVPRSTLSDELRMLVKLNYLEFHVSPQVLHDGRSRHYIITPKGISFLKLLKSALELSIRRIKEKKRSTAI
jgi:parallel beta-helix repeat protein